MSKSGPPPWLSKQSAISRYAVAILSIAVAAVAAQILTVFLHTEPIASSMISAIMFAAWFGGFGPGLLAIALALLAFHYYVVPPVNSFVLKHNLFSLGLQELPRLFLFSIAAFFVTFLSSTQRRAVESLRRSRDDLLVAAKTQSKIEGALRSSQMYLAEAQRLSQTGSFGWTPSSGEIFWSEESFRIFGYDNTRSVTLEMTLERVHPEDKADNAVKFTPEAGRVELVLLHQEGETLIRVTDTGPGIAEIDREAVTQRFYRSDKSRSIKGLGLGLSMVAAIIKLHGFDLRISAGPCCTTEIACPRVNLRLPREREKAYPSS